MNLGTTPPLKLLLHINNGAIGTQAMSEWMHWNAKLPLSLYQEQLLPFIPNKFFLEIIFYFRLS